MPSRALLDWQTDRTSRLTVVEAHCVAVGAGTPPNITFFDECLRGYVLHLSAHFQAYCRDLYTECTQVWIGGIPAGHQASAELQFFAGIRLEQGNASYENIKSDFERFGFMLDLQTGPAGPQLVTDLAHLNAWRNRAAHQGRRPLPPGTPQTLSLSVINGWLRSCNAIAALLDGIMATELHGITGVRPW